MALSDRLGSLLGVAGGAAATAAFPQFGPASFMGGQMLGSQLGGALGDFFHQQTPGELAQAAQVQRLQQPIPGINFAPIQQSAMNNFNNRMVPQLAEQYNGQQGAFATALGQGGSDLAERLAALRAQYDFQGAQMNQNREGMLGNLLSGQQNQMQNMNQFNQMQTGSGLNNLMNAFGQLGQANQFGVNQSGQAATNAENEQYRQLQQLLQARQSVIGQGQNYDTIYNQAQPGGVERMIQNLIAAAGR